LFARYGFELHPFEFWFVICYSLKKKFKNVRDHGNTSFFSN
jgi:hypothetical protein